MFQYEISTKEFNSFKDFIYQAAGINLGVEKKTLVLTRLSKRLRYYELDSFSEYFKLIMASKTEDERQMVVDLLTTNETYFFREPKHFNFLDGTVLKNWNDKRSFRVWSAASSTGEEAYSIAMLLDDCLGRRPWQVYGSDISTRVIEIARKGHYLQNRIDGIPREYLKKYCLKGIDEQEGTLLIDQSLRKNVSFHYTNLKKPLNDVGAFDVIFLRNVLIYFDTQTKKLIVSQLAEKLYRGGHLLVGHSETLTGLDLNFNTVMPTVYQKP
jgi:chemotaxis protein methyltransferase CheR